MARGMGARDGEGMGAPEGQGGMEKDGEGQGDVGVVWRQERK